MAQNVAEIGIGSQVVRNDFDNLPIFKEMRRVTDDHGNVFVRIPKFYIRKTSTAGKLSIQVSKAKITGSYLPKCFWNFDKNRELPYVDVGAYVASLNGTRLESKSGATPLVSRTISQFRGFARNNGTGYQQLDIHAVDMLQSLFYVEFATLHSQSIHPGYTGGAEAVLTGRTDGVVASSGAIGPSNTNQFKYRGIEDLWGHVWQFVDGLNIIDNQAWVCENAGQYASDVFASPYVRLFYKNSGSNGYVREMGFDPNRPYAQLPTVTNGANASTYYADNYWQDAGQRIALFGGGWPSGVNAGVSSWGLDVASSHTRSSVGGRLLKKPL